MPASLNSVISISAVSHDPGMPVSIMHLSSNFSVVLLAALLVLLVSGFAKGANQNANSSPRFAVGAKNSGNPKGAKEVLEVRNATPLNTLADNSNTTHASKNKSKKSKQKKKPKQKKKSKQNKKRERRRHNRRLAKMGKEAQ
eukprot:652232_1